MSLFSKRREDAGEDEAPASTLSSDSSATGTASGTAADDTTQHASEASGASLRRRGGRGAGPQSTGENVATIGGTIQFKGELTGDEDLEILGLVEGKIDLPSHQLTIGEGGRAEAEISAKTVLVLGKVTGNISATERLEIQASGVVEGDIRAPRLLIQEGAVVNGAIEMTNKPVAARTPTAQPAAPAAVSSGSR